MSTRAVIVPSTSAPAERASGYFYRPTLLRNCQQHMDIVRNEVFGPVLPMLTFRDLDEAIALAEGEQIDCAVLDVNLGGQPILPLADILRAKGAPFAFATGYGDAGLRDVDKGSLVLQKPFRETDLARILGELRAKVG